MRIFLFMSLIFSFFTCANAQEISRFKILEESIPFYNYPELRLTISKPCKLAEEKKLCEHLDFLNDITLKKAGLEGSGGQNPASVICKTLLSGKVYIGIDADNNENSFCRLKDGLYVDGGTITYYAEKNQGIVQKPRRREKYKKQ